MVVICAVNLFSTYLLSRVFQLLTDLIKRDGVYFDRPSFSFLVRSVFTQIRWVVFCVMFSMDCFGDWCVVVEHLRKREGQGKGWQSGKERGRG